MDFLNSIWEWSLKNIFSASALYQISFIGAAFLGSYFSSDVISQKLKSKIRLFRNKQGMSQGVFYLLFLFSIYLSIIILNLLGLPTSLSLNASTLLIAWIVVSGLSVVLGSTYGIQVLAVFIWSIAALSVFDLLPQVIKFLKSISVNLSGHKLTLWLVVKTILTISALMVGSNALLYLLRSHLSQRSNVPLTQRVLILKFTRVFFFILVVLVGLNFTGVDLTALAFMGGAIGVGLGFGLQKILSNLVSGFILLMDDSVKPGDIIAVKNTYGVVKKLRARYVSIVTRDGKKHLIPNDTMITEPVENWSFQDNQVRVRIPIGISYDDNPHKAKKLIVTAALEVGRVLKTPHPNCLLRRFGDNAIELELRAWVDDPQNGIENVVSEINFLIFDKFKQEGIKIPYPQRQIHIEKDQLFSK